MANSTDFISSVYDELARQLQITDANPSVVMQLAWPGYALSPADFRRADVPNGPYDAEVARETLSTLANIAPLLSRTRFENSGFEIDDLYEIVLSSAIPVGATMESAATNPIFRLFSDAQFEFMQARRGVHDDPNLFYVPCSATPAGWYDDSGQGWTTITLQQSDVKPADPAKSTFTRMGGAELARQQVWKLRPSAGDKSALTSKMQKLMKEPRVSKPLQPQAVDPSLLKKAAATRPGIPKLPPVSPGPGLQKLGPTAPIDPLAKSRFVEVGAPTSAFSRSGLDLSRVDLSKRNLGVDRLSDRLLLQKLLHQELPSRPPSPATDGFSVSFRFCRVSIERPWLKLALLSAPNWWMFGTQAGTYSTGAADSNPGMFPLLPTSLLVIRDLKITANWSAEDRANLGNAQSFGFFDVRDGTLNSNTLEVKGMQVIGWVSKLMPKLPPLGPQ